MAERLNMNAKQIEMFRNLYAPPREENEDEDEEREQQDVRLINHQDDADRSRHVTKAKQKLNSNSYVQSVSELHSSSSSGGNSEDASAQNIPGTHGMEHPQHHDEQVEPIMPNVRSIQPLNNRTILASFTKQGSRLKATLSSGASQNMSFQWTPQQNMWALLLTIMSSALATRYTTTTTTTTNIVRIIR